MAHPYRFSKLKDNLVGYIRKRKKESRTISPAHIFWFPQWPKGGGNEMVHKMQERIERILSQLTHNVVLTFIRYLNVMDVR